MVTRRDFLNGVALGTTVGMFAPGSLLAMNSKASLEPSAGFGTDYYPPTLTGMRGSHEGSYEVAHALAWRGEKPSEYLSLDEHYDLVVVGAGMSGLAAAWYYQKKMGGSARVLILDNHDDFGGPRKTQRVPPQRQNGAESLPVHRTSTVQANYSEAAGSLMRDLGIDAGMRLTTMDENTPDNYLLGGKWHGSVGMSLPGADGHVTVGGHWYKFFHGRGEYADRGTGITHTRVRSRTSSLAFFGGERDFLDGPVLEWAIRLHQFGQLQPIPGGPGRAFDRNRRNVRCVHLLILNGPSGWQHTVLEAILGGRTGTYAPWAG